MGLLYQKLNDPELARQWYLRALERSERNAMVWSNLGVLEFNRGDKAAGKTHYVPNDGIPELKGALRLKLEEHNDILLPDSDCIFVTNGAMHALSVTWQCLLEEGDEAFQQKLISIFSFSKSYAMSGLRVGCIVTRDARLQGRISKLLRCTINGVNSVTQWGAVAALKGGREHLAHMREVYRLRRDLMLTALTGVPGLHPFKPEGAFYLWCKLEPSLYRRLGVADADELSASLAERHGLGSAPGDSFGQHCDNAIRFAYSCSTEMVEEGSAVLAEVLRG